MTLSSVKHTCSCRQGERQNYWQRERSTAKAIPMLKASICVGRFTRFTMGPAWRRATASTPKAICERAAGAFLESTARPSTGPCSRI